MFFHPGLPRQQLNARRDLSRHFCAGEVEVQDSWTEGVTGLESVSLSEVP